ncbi:hypothetical protein ISR94_00595 [Candidatus Microgenomates bacterium]|nr:hypothetical protein [Candidatus Microgenomates bacterium]
MSIELSFGERLLVEKFSRLNNLLKRLNVGTDIDGVEIDSASSALRVINRESGTNYGTKDITSYWTLIELLQRDLKKIENHREYAMALWNSKESLQSAQPNPGALIISKFLTSEGVDRIHRITSRPTYTTELTYEWYRNKMPWVDRNLIHIHKDEADVNSVFKTEKIGELKIQLFFEDSFEHAEDIVRNTNAKVVLVPKPWNIGYKPSESGIIIVPETKYNNFPTMVRVYMHLADISA